MQWASPPDATSRLGTGPTGADHRQYSPPVRPAPDMKADRHTGSGRDSVGTGREQFESMLAGAAASPRRVFDPGATTPPRADFKISTPRGSSSPRRAPWALLAVRRAAARLALADAGRDPVSLDPFGRACRWSRPRASRASRAFSASTCRRTRPLRRGGSSASTRAHLDLGALARISASRPQREIPTPARRATTPSRKPRLLPPDAPTILSGAPRLLAHHLHGLRALGASRPRLPALRPHAGVDSGRGACVLVLGL